MGYSRLAPQQRTTVDLPSVIRVARPRWADYASDDDCSDIDQWVDGAAWTPSAASSTGHETTSDEESNADLLPSKRAGSHGQNAHADCESSDGSERCCQWPSRTAAAPLVNLTVRNIPSRACHEAIVEALQEFGYRGRFAYFYLPCKPRGGTNRGYAFVGFEDALQADAFRAAVDGRCLPGRESSKALFVDDSTSSTGVSERLGCALGSAAAWTEWGPILANRGGIRQSVSL